MITTEPPDTAERQETFRAFRAFRAGGSTRFGAERGTQAGSGGRCSLSRADRASDYEVFTRILCAKSANSLPRSLGWSTAQKGQCAVEIAGERISGHTSTLESIAHRASLDHFAEKHVVHRSIKWSCTAL